jgi:hypothetical protein
MIGTSLARSSIFWLKCVQILVNKPLTQTNISSCPQNIHIYIYIYIYMMSRTSGIIQSHSLSLHLSITMKLCEVSWGSSPYVYFSPSVGLQLRSCCISIQGASYKCQSWLIRNYAADPMTVKMKATAQGLTHLLRIREVSGPNLARYTGYTNIYNDFSPVPSDKCRNSTWK